jgi:hypothetical protein
MRKFSAFSWAIAALTLCCAPRGHAQANAGPPTPSEPAGDAKGCEVYFTIQPIDPAALKLLATPMVPVNRSVFAETSIKQLQEWDLPSKVTAWHERPSPEELARQWDELVKKFSAGSQSKDKSKNDVPRGYAAPYNASPLPPKEWRDIEKWFAKNAPKKLSGACVDPAKATYVLAVGIIGGGAGVSSNGANNPDAYNDYASKPQPDSLGPNTGTVAPYKTPHNELEIAGMQNGVSGNTCVYVYRTSGKGIGEGGMRQEAPDFYYCHAGSGISQSTVTTMLKYLTKAGLR